MTCAAILREGVEVVKISPSPQPSPDGGEGKNTLTLTLWNTSRTGELVSRVRLRAVWLRVELLNER